MGQTVSDCKVQACKPSDPTADTVKVDANLLTPESPLAQKPVPVPDEEIEEEAKRLEEEQRLEEERRQAEEEEEARRRLAEAEEARRRAEEAEAERLRQEEEERVRQEEEAERQRKEEAARAERSAREERERAAEAERVKAEQARAAAAKQREEAAAAQRAVDDFLKSKGFKNLAVPRKAFCGGSVYPLHLAAEENNAEIVKAMLLCGADKEVKDSGKKTPIQVAERCNKSGSHEPVVAALRGGA